LASPYLKGRRSLLRRQRFVNPYGRRVVDIDSSAVIEGYRFDGLLQNCAWGRPAPPQAGLRDSRHPIPLRQDCADRIAARLARRPDACFSATR